MQCVQYTVLDLWTGGTVYILRSVEMCFPSLLWPGPLVWCWWVLDRRQKRILTTYSVFHPHLPSLSPFLSFCPWLAQKCGFNCLWPKGFSKCQFSEFASTWNSSACKPCLYNSNAWSFIKLNKYLNKKPNLPHCNNRPCPNEREREAYSGFIFLIL